MGVRLDPEKVLEPDGSIRVLAREFFVDGRIVRCRLDEAGVPVVETDNPEFFSKLKAPDEIDLPVEVEDVAASLFVEEVPEVRGGFLDEVPISTLDIPRLMVASLERAGLEVLGDLQGKTEEDLTTIQGIGPTSAAKILRALEEFSAG